MDVKAHSTEIIPTNESCHTQEKLPKIEELSKTEEDKSPIKLNEEQMDCLNLSIDSTNSAFSNSQLDFIATINETSLLEKRIDLAERELEKVIENSQLVKELKKSLNCNLVLEKIEEEKSEHSQASPKAMDIDSIDQANLLSNENQNINLNKHEIENVFVPVDSLVMQQNQIQKPSKAVINETFILEKGKDLTMDVDRIDQANLLSNENQNHKIACSLPKNINTHSKTSAEENKPILRKSPVKKDVEEGEIDELSLNASKALFTQKHANKNKKNDPFDEYIFKCHEKSTAKNIDKTLNDKTKSSSKEKSIKRKDLDDNYKQTIKHQEFSKDKRNEYGENNKKSKANEIDNSKTKSDHGGDFIQEKILGDQIRK